MSRRSGQIFAEISRPTGTTEALTLPFRSTTVPLLHAPEMFLTSSLVACRSQPVQAVLSQSGFLSEMTFQGVGEELHFPLDSLRRTVHSGSDLNVRAVFEQQQGHSPQAPGERFQKLREFTIELGRREIIRERIERRRSVGGCQIDRRTQFSSGQPAGLPGHTATSLPDYQCDQQLPEVAAVLVQMMTRLPEITNQTFDGTLNGIFGFRSTAGQVGQRPPGECLQPREMLPIEFLDDGLFRFRPVTDERRER